MVDDNVRIEIGTKQKGNVVNIYKKGFVGNSGRSVVVRVNILRIYQKETTQLLHTCNRFLVDQSMMATQWDLLSILIQSLQK